MLTLHNHLRAIETIRVGPCDFKVVWDAALLGAQKLYGQTDYGRLEVALDPDLPIQKGRITVMHENIHMIDEAFQLGIEEREVTLLANALVMLFRDNPWLKELF